MNNEVEVMDQINKLETAIKILNEEVKHSKKVNNILFPIIFGMILGVCISLC